MRDHLDAGPDDAVARQAFEATEAAIAAIINVRRLSDRFITGGQPTEAQLAAIASAEYDVVINLAPLEGESALPDERRTVEALGMAYEHIPVRLECPALADLEAFFAAMGRHGNRRLCVHCAANMRVSAFMFLFRVLRLGWRVEDALPDLHALWRPNATWQAFVDGALGQQHLPMVAAGSYCATSGRCR